MANVRNALTASFVFQAGTSDIKTYGIHGFGYANSGTGPYRPQFIIQDFGTINTHTAPILDTFHEAGIDMEGSYNSVLSPIWEWLIAPDSASYLFEIGTTAKWNQFLGGNCHGLTGNVSQAYLFKDGHNISVAPAGSSYDAPSGCLGLYSYEWEDTTTTGRTRNYTTYNATASLDIYDLLIRNKLASSGTHAPLSITDLSNNVLLRVDDYGDTKVGSLGTTTTTFTASGSIASGTGTVLANAISAAITLTLPSCSSSPASPTNGLQIVVQKIDSSSHAITVATTGSQTINGASTLTIGTQYAAATVQCDSNSLNWFAH